MNRFLELTPTTMPVGTSNLRLSIDSIESYVSARPRSRAETIIVTKTGERHFVDESVSAIDAALAKISAAATTASLLEH